MGETIFPNNTPIFIHILFKGVKKLEFKIPNIKKIILMIKDQILISFALSNGQKAIIKKKIKKTIPKFLLDGIFIF